MPETNGSSPRSHSIASIPGDGIGVEVIECTIQVLRSLEEIIGTFTLHFTTFDWGSERYKKLESASPRLLQILRTASNHVVQTLDVPDHISLWGLILQIRKLLDQYVNVRPIRILPGLSSPLNGRNAGDLDWVIIRENSEGEYAGQGGTTHDDTAFEIANDVSVFTRMGVERAMRFAFETAAGRPRKRLTMVTKSNAQRYGMVLWDKVFNSLSPEYPEVQTDKMLVDAMTVRIVLKPESLDTIVTTNLHGDILSDLAAALSGSIGVAPSSNLNPTRDYPSLFEPIHGSAPDITGMGLANPVGTFWSAAEMLRWLDEGAAADGLMRAIEEVTKAGIKTKDVGGTASTAEVTRAVIKELESVFDKISC
ncbi:hypothetical protein B0J14DRAFT_558222 [Halenospora varia]|nr:hypothetical protein B0J14DRAFT_558222 [Halenospora varia]